MIFCRFCNFAARLMRNWIFSDLHRERLEQLTILDANVPKIKEALLKAPMITFSKQAVRYSYVMVIFVLNFFQIPPKKSFSLLIFVLVFKSKRFFLRRKLECENPINRTFCSFQYFFPKARPNFSYFTFCCHFDLLSK